MCCVYVTEEDWLTERVLIIRGNTLNIPTAYYLNFHLSIFDMSGVFFILRHSEWGVDQGTNPAVPSQSLRDYVLFSDPSPKLNLGWGGRGSGPKTRFLMDCWNSKEFHYRCRWLLEWSMMEVCWHLKYTFEFCMLMAKPWWKKVWPCSYSQRIELNFESRIWV